MQKLIYLIIMALAGAAGWYAGSWKGRDAIAALDKAKAVGEQAIAERDKLQQDLQQNLAKLTAEFEKGQQQRDAEHQQVTARLKDELDKSEGTIKLLKQARDVKQTEIRRLAAMIDSKATSPDERIKLQAQIAALQKDVADKEAKIAGFECTKVPVPTELLSPLQGS